MAEHPIDAVADHQRVFIGLDVDVRGPLADRLDQQIVDELDDAGFLCLFDLVGVGGGELRFRRFGLPG